MELVRPPHRLLCVANYKANTGYAWDFIESLYARVADDLAKEGIRTFVAYPEIDEPPRPLLGSAAQAVVLDFKLGKSDAIEPVTEFIRRENVHVLYLTDWPSWSWAYPRFRKAGVRRIVVHDHVSGEVHPASGIRRVLKYLLMRTPGLVADLVIAVSDYVARRQKESGMVPPGRVVRVWNGVPEYTGPECRGLAHRLFRVESNRPLVMCACRAAEYKGVHHLIRAFDRVLANWRDGARPALLYFGDGPYFAELNRLRDSLASRDDIVVGGYRADSRELLAAADLCVIPSVWHEACPLAVLEAMAMGKTIVASRVGAIPELVQDRQQGILVPPADESALAAAISRLLLDRQLAATLGQAARRRAREEFTPERQIDSLHRLIRQCFQ